MLSKEIEKLERIRDRLMTQYNKLLGGGNADFHEIQNILEAIDELTDG